MNKFMHFTPIKMLLLLASIFLAACSESNNTDQAGSQQKQQTLKTYPQSQLTEELNWITNNDDPIFADPAATKGGTFRTYMTTFPLTLRTVGPDSNNQMRAYLQDNILSPVGQHPDTENIIPELATHWAYGADKKTVYYKLDPNARWSDGKAITADDYLFTIDFMRSPHIVAPWYNNHYSTEIIEVKKYDDYTISITGATEKPQKDLHYYYGLPPMPRHFHHLDEKWVTDYNWKVAPSTGPYHLTKVKKGKYLEFELKEDWWAKDLRYFKHRFNVKRVRIKVIRDEEIAYKHFLKGDLDAYGLGQPRFWHERAKGDLFERGFIHKIWFYNDIPRSPFGLYLNQDNDLFADQHVRYGLAHALNINGMIKKILRGDFERLPSFNVGFGEYSNATIKPRAFNIDQANDYFNKAGWVNRGPDGIRVKDKQRLSLSITYSSGQHDEKLVFLKEEAKKVGVELILEKLDGSSFFKKLNEKTYQMALLGFGGGYRPAFWQHFHSDNAHKPQTNNLTNTDNPIIDEKIVAYRAASDEDQRQQLSREINQLVHDQGAFIPGYYAPYTRSAYWRWIKLPEFHATKKNRTVLSPFGATGGLFWIDQAEKDETLSNKNTDKAYTPITIIDRTHKG